MRWLLPFGVAGNLAPRLATFIVVDELIRIPDLKL
jgi:hypothetical protein